MERRRCGRAAWLALALAAPLGALVPVQAAEPTYVAGVGMMGADPVDPHTPMIELECRFAPGQWHLAPMVGAIASSGATFLHAGLVRDFDLGEDWNANLSIGAGWYQAGTGKDLGKGLEFRSAFEVSYRLGSAMRAGMSVGHLSNGGIASRNPGIETVTLSLAWLPLGSRR